MDNLKLPDNFNKYATIITYYRNNNIDCLSTLVEWFRFYILHIYSKKRIGFHSNFVETLKTKTNLRNKKENRWGWGWWSDPDLDGYDSYNINKLELDMPGVNCREGATKYVDVK